MYKLEKATIIFGVERFMTHLLLRYQLETVEIIYDLEYHVGSSFSYRNITKLKFTLREDGVAKVLIFLNNTEIQ